MMNKRKILFAIIISLALKGFAQTKEIANGTIIEKENIDGKTERWAKIEYKGITGWVFGGYLEIERGGPKFCTPEWDIEMTLGAGI